MSHSDGALPLNLFSPSGSSLPNLSSQADSPLTWNDQHVIPHSQIYGAATDIDQKVDEKLFRDEEKHALDTFLSERLEEKNAQVSNSNGGTASSRPPDMNAKRPSTEQCVSGVDEAESTRSNSESVKKDGEALIRATSPVKRLKVNSAAFSIAPKSGSSHDAKRSNHIASEQRRRTTIKDNYKSLVDLLLNGEETSGISLGNSGGTEDVPADGPKGKSKGRGRGRKSQDGAGATKSVVLEKAADYLKWLQRTNLELEKEVTRIEATLGLTA